MSLINPFKAKHDWEHTHKRPTETGCSAISELHFRVSKTTEKIVVLVEGFDRLSPNRRNWKASRLSQMTNVIQYGG